MARKGGNPDIKKHGFKKGDPNINRLGGPRKLPDLPELLMKVLGTPEIGQDKITGYEMIIRALRLKAARGDTRAADILLNRGYGQAKAIVNHEVNGVPITGFKIIMHGGTNDPEQEADRSDEITPEREAGS